MYSYNYAGGRRAIGVLVQMKLEWDQFQWGWVFVLLGVARGRSGLGGLNKSGGAEGWVWAWWCPHHVKGQQSGTMVVGGRVVQGNTWLASPCKI